MMRSILALTALLLASSVALAYDQVATCDAPSLSCVVKFVPATADTQTFNTSTGAACWVTQTTCLWRKLSAMASTDQVMSRTGTDGSTEGWHARSTVTYVATVPAAGTGKATLTWSAPTVNTDGSAITDALTYNVYRGPSATAFTLLKAGATSPYVDSGLAAGTHYYTVTAVNSANRESAQATPASLTIAPLVVTPKTPSAPGSVAVTVTVTVP